MSTYRSRVTGSDEETYQALGESMPCMFCGTVTKHEILCLLSRCARCYANYRAQSQPSPDIGDKGNRGYRDWAYALQRRELAGDRLTQTQRQMWRALIKPASDEVTA